MTLHELADELIEIRRYVRSHPDHVEERLRAICMPIWPVPDQDQDLRLCENIEVGRNRIVVNPEILEGYLYGAAAEIRELAMREELGK